MSKNDGINDDPNRPDPEALLKYVEEEEAAKTKGKLKIFLGYSAGVGKTYATLEATQRLKKDGVDIVVGYIETHKRAETEALIEGLEIIPRKALSYRNTTLYEMDLDAVLKRQPKIAVVDELAHTNAPGSRHTKRYQDVEELLSNGIDVYTTLNIQHLESLNDVLAKVTGITMRETVPDTILDEADEIEVVDLPIGELVKRLREGKVYVPEQAERALQSYFSEKNLNALRELTLRRAAKRVDTQIQSFLRGEVGQRSARERLIVCVSSYASSAELVRAAKLLAAGLDADWYAVYVDTGHKKLSEEEEDRVTRSLQLAEELGAKPVTLSGRNVAEEIVNYARSHQITKILIGKPLRRRISDVLYGSVVDRLIRSSGEIDVYVITRSTKRQEKAKSLRSQKRAAPGKYMAGVLLVVLAALVSAVARNFLAPTNLVMFYLLAVVVSAVFFGKGPSILTAVLSVAVFDFFFIPPFYTFTVYDTQYLFTFLVLLIVGLLISTLTARIKEQAESARAREAFSTSLYNLSRDLGAAKDVQSVAQFLSSHIFETLEAKSVIFVKEEENLKPYTDGDVVPDAHESAVVEWVLKNGESAGWSTDTLPGSSGYYLPLKTIHGIFGAIGVYFKTKSQTLPLDRKRLLDAFASQSAIAIERIRFQEEVQKTRLLEEREKLQSALFNSISHDLRTPLVSITGSLSGMLENLKMDESSRKDLLENAYEEAGRLNRLVGNLLDMARLEADALKVMPHLSEVSDIIGAAQKALEEKLSDRRVTVEIEKDLPHIPMDFSLMMKVLVNLLDNAVKYAPFGLPIDIEAKKNNGFIEIKILDRGLGIPERDLENVFNKFYRVKRPQNIEGTGLGLSICKGIVEAHHGKIWAENRPGGGTIVTMSLPVRQ